MSKFSEPPWCSACGVLGVLVEDELAVRDRPGERGVGREARDAIVVGRPERVEDVVEVVAGEVGVEDEVVDALLHAGRADVGDLEEETGIWLRVGRGEDLDLARQFRDQHAPVREELERRREVEAGGQDLVLEVVGVGDVDGHGRRGRRVAGRVPGPRGDRVRAVADRPGVPAEPVGRACVLRAGRRAVDQESDAGDADVVARVGGHLGDVAHGRVGLWCGDGDRWRIRVHRAARIRPEGDHVHDPSGAVLRRSRVVGAGRVDELVLR